MKSLGKERTTASVVLVLVLSGTIGTSGFARQAEDSRRLEDTGAGQATHQQNRADAQRLTKDLLGWWAVFFLSILLPSRQQKNC